MNWQISAKKKSLELTPDSFNIYVRKILQSLISFSVSFLNHIYWSISIC